MLIIGYEYYNTNVGPAINIIHLRFKNISFSVNCARYFWKIFFLVKDLCKNIMEGQFTLELSKLCSHSQIDHKDRPFYINKNYLSDCSLVKARPVFDGLH